MILLMHYKIIKIRRKKVMSEVIFLTSMDMVVGFSVLGTAYAAYKARRLKKQLQNTKIMNFEEEIQVQELSA